MSSYFDVLSWTRARQNREALEKTNPKNPVLNDDDEEFLQRITSQEAPAPPLPTIEPTVIDDEGNEKEADVSQKEAAEMILPASPGEGREKRTWASYIPNVGVPSVPTIPAMPSLASLRGQKADAKVGAKEAAQPEDGDGKTDTVTGEKQEPSEKSTATASLPEDKSDAADKIDETAQSAKETAQDTTEELNNDSTTTGQEIENASQDDTTSKLEPESKEKTAETEEQTNEPTQRTWASYIPTVPTIPTFGRNTKATEAAEAAAKAQTPESKEQDEREVSVLLDRLNLSAINNRVFSFSDQSQKLYGEFTLILKDIVNGAPTAWEDLETLLKENERHLEQMFKNMPPFVQTLVKSLPSKFATSMGPEIMAMAGDKPGNDLKKRMEAAASTSSSATAPNINLDVKKKQKRKIPNIKDLASQKGTVTSMLTNIVNFLKVRFPAFVTGTNVVMSLAVFILLFVFWYCHKRGKEVRMLKAAEQSSANISEVSDSESEIEEQDSNNNTAEKETTDTADKQTPKMQKEEKKVAEEEKEEVLSDTEDQKIANAKAYAAAMQKATVGGPDNAAAARARKVLEG